MLCKSCGKEGIKKTYGVAQDCWGCYCKRLKLSSRGILELQKLRTTIKSLRGSVYYLEEKIKILTKKNRDLQSEIDGWEQDFENQVSKGFKCE